MSKKNPLIIGVLAIQGSFAEHLTILGKLGVDAREVRTKRELDNVSGLIIPGGESTTIGKLLKHYGLNEEIKKRAKLKIKPLTLWGTCAGAILMAKEVVKNKESLKKNVKSALQGFSKPDILSLIDISIIRNAYGPQTESFETELAIPKLGEKPVPAIFIRAPLISRVGKGVEIVAMLNDAPVIVQYNNLLVSTFHPELTDDLRVHRYFVSLTNHYATTR